MRNLSGPYTQIVNLYWIKLFNTLSEYTISPQSRNSHGLLAISTTDAWQSFQFFRMLNFDKFNF